MNPTLILMTPKLSAVIKRDSSNAAVFPFVRRRIVEVRCNSSSGAEGSNGRLLKETLSGMVGEEVEELLNREENKVLLDDLEKATVRVEKARMELKEIEKQENEAKRMKAYVNQLQTRASEIDECQKEMLKARTMVQEAELALAGGKAPEKEMDVSKDEERVESVKAALIAAIVGSVAGLPLTLSRAAEASDLILPLGVTFASCALFGVTFRYVVRRDLDDVHLKTGAATAFGVVKGLGTLAGGAQLELNSSSFLSHAIDGAIFISGDLLVFLLASVGLDFCFKMKLLSPYPTKRAVSNTVVSK